MQVKIIVIYQLIFSSGVNGHGYVRSPRSRNWVAYEDGVWNGATEDHPEKETCPHCLNRGGTLARCGETSSNNYDYPMNGVGGPMRSNIQAVYNEGQIIDIETVVTAHHKGHWVFKACAIEEGEVPEQSCFDSNPLDFVEDTKYGAPVDPNYPSRAYIPLTTFPNYEKDSLGWHHYHKYKLPDNVSGELVLLQWHWITANSCRPEGYDEYDFPEHFEPGNLDPCDEIPEDGNGKPEQFWNCAEVKIIPSGPTSTPAPVAPITPAPVAPTTPSPTPPPISIGEGVAGEDSRLIAYLGNWQSCPSTEQTDQYTHIVIAFAVSYTWSPSKNICDQSCNIGSPVPICSNQNNQALVDSWREAGKKVILSFGGAGMGGSWDGDVNDCWDYCYGKEAHVINQLDNIVRAQNFDGVDIDYEYFYDSNEAQNFLKTITTGLRDTLPEGSIVTHAPMDPDLLPTTAYYNVLKEVASSLDFIMPQYYNGNTRPAIDGIDSIGAGSISAISHYDTLTNDMFDGEPEKVVFGFCISDCSGTGSNANANQAAVVMSDLRSYYPCNGGAFFWVTEHDTNGSWSKTVSQQIFPYSGCSIPQSPTSSPHPTMSPTTLEPTKTSPPSVSTSNVPTRTPSDEPTCPNQYTGLLATQQCTHYYHCVSGSVVGEPIACYDGTLFNEALQSCDWEYNFSCPTDAPVQSPSTNAPVQSPLSYAPTEAPVQSPTYNPICSSGYYGLTLATEECTHYNHCVDGSIVGESIPCPSGTLFNAAAKYCDWESNVSCDSENNPIPSLTPTSTPCTDCNDQETPYMINKGKNCTTANLNNKCKQNSNWIANKYCMLSCYNSGNGYDGIVCCNN